MAFGYDFLTLIPSVCLALLIFLFWLNVFRFSISLVSSVLLFPSLSSTHTHAIILRLMMTSWNITYIFKLFIFRRKGLVWIVRVCQTMLQSPSERYWLDKHRKVTPSVKTSSLHRYAYGKKCFLFFCLTVFLSDDDRGGCTAAPKHGTWLIPCKKPTWKQKND